MDASPSLPNMNLIQVRLSSRLLSARKKIRDQGKDITMEKQNELTHQPLLLTVPQVAKKLGLSRTMVYILINREGLPVLRFGRAVRISAPSLQKWVEEREQSSMSTTTS